MYRGYYRREKGFEGRIYRVQVPEKDVLLWGYFIFEIFIFIAETTTIQIFHKVIQKQ